MRVSLRTPILFVATMAATWSCSLVDDCEEHSGPVTYDVGRRVSVAQDGGRPPVEFEEVPRNDALLSELLAMPCAALCERLRGGAPPDGKYTFGTQNVRLDSCSPVEEREERGARDGRLVADGGDPSDERVFSVTCQYSFRYCPSSTGGGCDY